MQIVNKLMMLSVAVSNMPKAKTFYTDKLDLAIKSEYRQDDNNWWVSLTAEGGATITLTTAHENMQPGTMKLYFSTIDVSASHKELSSKSLKLSEIKDDLFGPGSGVKWFDLKDPDGNQVFLVEN